MSKEQLLEEFEEIKSRDPNWEYRIDGDLFSFKYGKSLNWDSDNITSINMKNGEIYSKGSSEHFMKITKKIQNIR